MTPDSMIPHAPFPDSAPILSRLAALSGKMGLGSRRLQRQHPLDSFDSLKTLQDGPSQLAAELSLLFESPGQRGAKLVAAVHQAMKIGNELSALGASSDRTCHTRMPKPREFTLSGPAVRGCLFFRTVRGIDHYRLQVGQVGQEKAELL